MAEFAKAHVAAGTSDDDGTRWTIGNRLEDLLSSSEKWTGEVYGYDGVPVAAAAAGMSASLCDPVTAPDPLTCVCSRHSIYR